MKDSTGLNYCFSVAQGDTPLLHFLLGKYDKPPTFKVSPWPSIPTGIHVNSSVTFTPGKLKLTWRCSIFFTDFQLKVISLQSQEEELMKFHSLQRIRWHNYIFLTDR